VYILDWGSLQKVCPELLLRLKDRLRSQSSCRFEPASLYDPPEPFPLELPQETPLLAFLGPALALWMINYGSPGRRLVPAEQIFETLRRYNLRKHNLREVVESDAGTEVRAGALALYWMIVSKLDLDPESQPGAEVTLSLPREKALYEQLVTDDNEFYLSLALVRGVLIRRPESDPGARAFVSYLLERCLNGAGPRMAVSELLDAWRERSTAPVNSSQVLQSWLSPTTPSAT
jgi:hypothetical protein